MPRNATKSKSTAICPTEVRIVGRTYAIEFIDGFHLAGECSNGKQRIKIESGNASSYERDTVLHEILHAIDYNMQSKMNERQVATMASGLLAVLQENPSLVEYLLDKSGL